ncbi:hypothetical protein QQX98_003987 [Neonectria punicea]|uniref:CCHC-type domain-containing protein n=1 Tax=Neonectria punicea TaxID=979145 RepID=A0ABR1HBX6_9HYPO
MDSDHIIISNMREVVGCTGLRNFTDLGRMRQDTLEKRLTSAEQSLSPDSMAAIYTAWLCNQTPRMSGDAKLSAMKRWSGYLNLSGCSKFRATCLWDVCVDRALERMNEVDMNDFIMESDDVRDFILDHWPNPLPELCEYPPIDLDSIKTSECEPKRQLSDSPPQSLKRKNIFSLRLDLKKDSGDTAAAETSPDFESGSRLSDTISPVPKNYRCRRCGIGGHLIKDCPTNSDPFFDLMPKPDYVCHLCGTEGDHYIFTCPKDKHKIASVSPPNRKRSAPADEHEHEHHGRFVIGENRDGRLSPWGSSSIYNLGSSAEPSPSKNHTVKEAAKQANMFLNDLEPYDTHSDLPYGKVKPSGFASHAPRPSYPVSGFADYYYGQPDQSAYRDVMKTFQPTHWGHSKTPQPAYGGCTKRQRTDAWGEKARWSMCDEMDAPEHTLQQELEPVPPVAEYTDIHSTYTYASMPFNLSEADIYTPPQVHVTEKKVEYPAYDADVVELFSGSNNTWVNTFYRPNALDMWFVQEE